MLPSCFGERPLVEDTLERLWLMAGFLFVTTSRRHPQMTSVINEAPSGRERVVCLEEETGKILWEYDYQ